jgi:hypothetical protein
MKTLKNVGMAMLVASLCVGCGSKSEEEKAREEPKSPLEALQKIGEEAQKMTKEGGKPKETIDPKLLKGLLPTDIDGLKRTEAESEKVNMMGFGISTAKAKYESGNEQINISINDVAGAQIALMGLAAWSMASIDKETEHGYEKTTEIDGHKAFEKYNTDSKNGEISVLVANRFVVQVEGRGVSMDKIKAALNDIDLDKLAGL